MRVKRMPEFPPRPYIPPLFWCALGSIVISMVCSRMLGNELEREDGAAFLLSCRLLFLWFALRV